MSVYRDLIVVRGTEYDRFGFFVERGGFCLFNLEYEDFIK